MNKINENFKLGEIVSIFPGSSTIFNEYKIDYCCGGHGTLKEAIEEKGISSEKIVNQLNDEYQRFVNSNTNYVDWREKKPSEIIRYVLEKHHHFTKEILTEIDFLMFKILKVHFQNHEEELLKVHRLFGLLKIELQQHLVKEEENLFPLIEAYEQTEDKSLLNKIQEFIQDTEHEHDEAGNLLKEIEKVTHDFTAPSNSCNTYRLVYAKLNELEKDLFNHIYLENTVLFNKLK